MDKLEELKNEKRKEWNKRYRDKMPEEVRCKANEYRKRRSKCCSVLYSMYMNGQLNLELEQIQELDEVMIE